MMAVRFTYILFVLAFGLLWISCSNSRTASENQKTTVMENSGKSKNPYYSHTDDQPVSLSEEEWQKILPPEVYRIARQKGTERPFSSPFETLNEIGTYYCAACGNPLFQSDTKFDSGCGWPRFYKPISKPSTISAPDHSHGMVRTAVMCGRCKAHLGHVFDDGPPPTGLRYCINGVVLDFEKAQKADKDYKKNL